MTPSPTPSAFRTCAPRRAAFAIAAVLLAACPSAPKEAPFTPPSTSVLLPIVDRPWAPGAPPEGWCGEASIQMVALHFGLWATQRHINHLGAPSTPDLWEDDLPKAMSALGLRFERYAGPATHDDFLRWMVASVEQGHPVIVGAKLYPTQHPDWDVDHLMPVVGFTPQHLILNSNLKNGQVRVPWGELSRQSPISFLNTRGTFIGFAVSGRAR